MPEPNPGVEYDPKAWREMSEHLHDLASTYDKRDQDAQQMADLWLMDWKEDRPKTIDDDTKLTISPDAANSLTGAFRLLTATEPQISVPFDASDAAQRAVSSKAEKFLKIMWQASGRQYGAPLHMDCVLSALMFAEVDIVPTLTMDLLEDIREQEEEAKDDPYYGLRIQAAEELAELTPCLYEVCSPIGTYAERDRFGLALFARKRELTTSQIEAEFGYLPSLLGKKRNLKHNVWEIMDRRFRACAIGSLKAPYMSEPIYMDEHGLGFVPAVSQIIEGTRLFAEPEKQRRAFLYTLVKSGLANRQNLALTVLYSTVYAIASIALWKHTSPPGSKDKKLNVDMTRGKVAVVELEAGEQLEPMFSKGAIDPALMQALEIAERKGVESTISRQALGEPLGANAPYSMVALLHQAGRLPLITPQKLTGWAIADALELSLKMMRSAGQGKAQAAWMNESAEITLADLPKRLPIEVKLEIDLPQDWTTMAQVALQLTQAQLASRRFVREKMLNQGQSEQMDEEIWSEKAGEEMFKMMLIQVLQTMGPKPPPGGGTENEVPPEGGGPTGMPPRQPPEGAPLPPGNMPPGAPA